MGNPITSPPASSLRLQQRLWSTTPRASPLITLGLSNADVGRLTYLSPKHRQVLHPHDLPQDRRRQPRPGVLWGIDTASHRTATASTTGAAHPYHWQDGRGALRVSLAPAATRMALRLEPSAGQGRAARPTGGGGAVRGWQKTMTRPGQRSGPRPHHRGEIRPDAWRHTSKPWTSTCCRGATPTPERVASRPHPPCRSCHESHPQSEGCGDTGDRALRDRPDLWWCRSLVAAALGADPLPPATIDRPVGWPVRRSNVDVGAEEDGAFAGWSAPWRQRSPSESSQCRRQGPSLRIRTPSSPPRVAPPTPAADRLACGRVGCWAKPSCVVVPCPPR